MSEKSMAQHENVAPALNAAIGERLVMLRLRSGRSVAEVAASAGIARQHLYRLEKGRVANPGVELLSRLAAALGAQVGELLPLEQEAEGVLDRLRVHWDQLDDANRSALCALATDLATASEAGDQYRLRPRRPGRGSQRHTHRSVPDEIKVIAQFFAQREGHPKRWVAYTEEASALRRELRSRSR